MMATRAKYKNRILFVILFGYHLLFNLIAFNFFREKGGDASFYWLEMNNAKDAGWFEYLNYGSRFVQFINYPFAKWLSLDIAAGFLIYSTIGFLGILQLYRLMRFHIGTRLRFYGIDWLPLFLFLPNLHFWTAMLGKEPLCFLFIATILLELSRNKFKSLTLATAVIFLIVIRPHFALMLLLGLFIAYFLFGEWSTKVKLFAVGTALLIFSVLFYMFLQLSKIRTLDFEKMMRYNEFSLLSFKNSDTYVPIIEYSYPYKVFTFYFRPLFNDIPSFYGYVAGVENILVLALHIVAIALYAKHFRKMVLPLIFRGIVFFAVISGLLIVQRYSGFGIFARTKIMILPFVIVVLLWIVAEARRKVITVSNEKTDSYHDHTAFSGKIAGESAAFYEKSLRGNRCFFGR